MVLCDWREAAFESDFIVLNRGYHSLGVGNMTTLMNSIHTTVSEVASSHRGHRIIYRGTSASMPACARLPDPWTGPQVDVTLRSQHNKRHNWRFVGTHDDHIRDTIAMLGVAYLSTYKATGMRPGGRMPGGNCNHWCLPGPPDEWVRILLAYWT